MNILIFGPNGSGKGSQGALLKKRCDLVHIESGGIFRDHLSKGTELGKKAKEYMDHGDLVPDDITIPMVLESLQQAGANRWLLDGFPRNVAQAEKLWEALANANMTLDYVIELQLPREDAQKRITGRRICENDSSHPNNINNPALLPVNGACRICGGALSTRPDDQNEASITKRHEIYYDEKSGTLAAVHFFKKLAEAGQTAYIMLDSRGDIDEVNGKLLQQLRIPV